MAKLTHKTIANENPHGKPRVFFCCHPKDYALYFSEITAQIFATHDCAIWYDCEPHIPYAQDKLTTELAQMQLVVLPVTTRFLCEANYALDVIFPFAIENHIPILPLMQECGLETLFNEKCGDLQFLDKYARDITAIRYEDKLKKYLDAVLVDSETAAKIRAAFDAYIFLSYRKKDRAYAQELMRLIHKNELCRDIAIWYDEFLTPGENFNDSIAEALKKSAMFVLAVTPNLVNEENYILSTEYPMAKTQSKPIFPVEMVKTDKFLLSDKLPALPDCVTTADDAIFQDALHNAVRSIALHKQNTSPEHIFFIGLAYHAGIDVEVDRERAIQMITQAAEGGLLEAMHTLADFYADGNGVARDYEASIHWQTKLVDAREEVLKKTHLQMDAHALIEALLSLGGLQAKLYRFQEAQSTFTRLCAIADACLAANPESEVALRYKAHAHTQLANICRLEQNHEEAVRYMRDALAIFDSMVAANNAYLLEIFLVSNATADICRRTGDYEAAQDYIKKALEIGASLAKEVELVLLRHEIAACHLTLGEIAMDKSDFQTAQAKFEEALKITEHLAEETDAIDEHEAVFVCCDRLGALFQMLEKPKQAMQYYIRAIQILEDLTEKSGELELLQSLALLYSKLGKVYEMQSQSSAQWKAYQKSLTLYKKLAEYTKDTHVHQEHCTHICQMGIFLDEHGHRDVAKRAFGDALEIAERIYTAQPTPEIGETLAICYDNLGRMHFFEKEITSALSFFQKAFNLRIQSAAEDAQNEDKQYKLGMSHYYLGTTAEGDKKLAHLQKALDIWAPIMQRNPQIKLYKQNYKHVQSLIRKAKRHKFWHK